MIIISKVILSGAAPEQVRDHACGLVSAPLRDMAAQLAADPDLTVSVITYQDGRVYADAKGTKNLYSEDVESMGLFWAVLSRMEVRKMQRRQRDSHRSRAERGIPVGGNRPFGWEDDRTTLRQPEARLLAKAARDFLADKSLHTICMEWTAAGVKTSVGNNWTMRSLKLAIWNPRICGWRRLNDEIVRDPSGEPVIGSWEPIITPQ